MLCCFLVQVHNDKCICLIHNTRMWTIFMLLSFLPPLHATLTPPKCLAAAMSFGCRMNVHPFPCKGIYCVCWMSSRCWFVWRACFWFVWRACFNVTLASSLLFNYGLSRARRRLHHNSLYILFMKAPSWFVVAFFCWLWISETFL